MKILITGGAGFIGSNFVHHMLAEHPDSSVVVTDKLTYAGNLRNLDGAAGNPRFQFVRLDVCDPAVNEIAAGCRAGVHLSAQSHVGRGIEDGTPFFPTNRQGTWRMGEAGRKNRGGRFLHVTTAE